MSGRPEQVAPVDGDPVGPGVDAELLDHITQARWFAGKGRDGRLLGIHPLPWLTRTGQWPAVRAEIAEIGYPDGEVEQYQLLLSYRRSLDDSAAGSGWGTTELPDLGPVRRHDAARDPEAVSALLTALLGQHEAGDAAGTVRCRTVETHPLRGDLLPRVFAGEQSNTSVMLGEVAMIKAFRRLEPGRNLDIEVHRALAGDVRARAAGLYGWIEAEWSSRGQQHRADLAMVVEQLHQARDGWDLALAACLAGTDFSTEAHALGVALRGVHEALADHFPTGRYDGSEVAATMTRRLHEANAQAGELEPFLGRLDALFGALAADPVATQRVHGDFHLGQTLLTSDGWKIIDFEGEPLKSMAERRAPDSVWRDVAGLLRSFDYAAGTTAAAAASTADTATDRPAAEQRAWEWSAACRTAFLVGYQGTDQLDAVEQRLLAGYLADKAVYEVVYEVRNRPAWVGIPLRAIEDLTEHRTGEDHDHHVEHGDVEHRGEDR